VRVDSFDRWPDLGDENAAHTPSPVCLNKKPPCAWIAERTTSSCAASAARIASASASHRRVEPSTSVKRNVTTPDGRPALTADTQAECHTEHGRILHIGRSASTTGVSIAALASKEIDVNDYSTRPIRAIPAWSSAY
jgi:hypothetical protein